ncbi:hypothetical protein FQA39_LY17963 [Lamprigera yunnana]|nr:hypothetical protein FQA39_LY17963 [Lamprigera yunnana]
MDSADEIMQVCRLCLVKEEVNTPIFDEEGDDDRIFLKISTCLPVKVSKEDNLPKNICDGCSSKLEELYEFWNKSASSEKKLVKWLCQLELDKSDKMQHSMNTSDPVILKQEVVDVAEGDSTGDDLIPEDLNVSNDAPDYMLQEQLPYQPVEIQFQQDGFETTSENSLAEKETKGKLCKRRAAAMKALASFQSEDEDDADLVKPKIAKTEDPSDESGEEPEPTAFVSLPSGDNEQPGPSGVGKSSNDAPSNKRHRHIDRTVHIGKVKVEAPDLDSIEKRNCNICSDNFQKQFSLRCHHRVVEKKHHKLKGNPQMPIKEEIIEEELNLTFSTDDEEDELEVVFNEGSEIIAEEMHNLLVEKLSNSSSLVEEGHCVLCNNGKIMSAVQLRKHYKKHEQILLHFKEPKVENDNTCSFYCHICKDDKVMSKQELRAHYMSEHDTKIPNNRKFFRRARSKRPRSPRPEVFRCEICSKEFATKPLLEEHFDNHDDQYSCDICDTSFKKLIDYTFHMQEHSEDKLYKCPLCEFKTDKGYLVKSHLYSVHDQFKKYKCELCGKGFAIFTHFQEHKYFHTGEKPFQCNECGQKFMYTRYLNSHKVQMHKKAQKGIECRLCNKVYSHRNSLNTHMKSHTGSVSICDVCGKTLSSNEKLRLHYRIHTGEKPYKCDYCNKCFKTSSYRAEHERIHTGEKPYECPFCGKGFSQRTSMVIHSRGHTGEKPYFCHLCNKAFAAKSMVTIHLKSCKGVVGHVIEDDQSC